MSDSRATQRMLQISLPTLFTIVAVSALLSCVPKAVLYFRYHERRAIERLLSECDKVELISYGSFNDGGIEEVVSARLRVTGRPDTFLSVGGLEHHQDGSLDHVLLRRIGNLRFIVGKPDTDDKRLSAWANSLDVGPQTDLPCLAPIVINSLEDFASNYDELLKHYSDWPRKHLPGRATTTTNQVRRYYVREVERSQQTEG